MKYNNIKIEVYDDYEQVSKAAAELIAAEVKQKPDAVLGFATGGTPVGTYGELIRLYKEGTLDFSRVTTFNLDEYYPIKRANDQSYWYFMHDTLFNHINVDKSRVNILNGEAEDWEKEVEEYENKIIAAGGIDLQVLGIGNNGHIAFNEPSDAFVKYTSIVNLTDNTIMANSRFFESEKDVPKKALSMGLCSIMMAKKIVLIASGRSKSEVLKKAVQGDITPRLPGSVLQFHKDVTFIIDKDASF